MECMFIKYQNGIRYSIIKQGDIIMVSTEKILSFENKKKTIKSKNLNTSHNKELSQNYISNKDQEITQFFFDIVHKNYLSKRR